MADQSTQRKVISRCKNRVNKKGSQPLAVDKKKGGKGISKTTLKHVAALDLYDSALKAINRHKEKPVSQDAGD